MKIILTSFRHSKTFLDLPKYSTARWSPKPFNHYPELLFLAPFDPDIPSKPLTAGMDPDLFMRKYNRVLEEAKVELDAFLADVEDDTIVMCCWCYMSRQPTQEHLYCHTILLGRFIEEHWDVEVEYLDGRHRDWFSDIYLGED